MSKNGRLIGLLLAIDVAVLVCVFSVSGFFNDKVDTVVYVDQIRLFSGTPATVINDSGLAARNSKPLYGIVGAVLVHIMSPYEALLVLNLLFFFGLSIISFFLFQELGFAPGSAWWGSIWVVTGYPMLKYGLALGTDISGWFFAAATALAALLAIRSSRMRLMAAAGCIGFIGSLAKETGVLGLVFAGVSIIMHLGAWPLRTLVRWLLALSLPFLAFEAAFLAILHAYEIPNFVGWYASNHETFAGNYYHLNYFLGVEASAFSVLAVFAALGIFFAAQNGDIMKRAWLGLYVPLLAASLPVLLWPIFISRIIYIQFLVVVPLALYGLEKVSGVFSLFKKRYVPIFLAMLPLLMSFALFLLSGTGSLFTVFKQILLK